MQSHWNSNIFPSELNWFDFDLTDLMTVLTFFFLWTSQAHRLAAHNLVWAATNNNYLIAAKFRVIGATFPSWALWDVEHLRPAAAQVRNQCLLWSCSRKNKLTKKKFSLLCVLSFCYALYIQLPRSLLCFWVCWVSTPLWKYVISASCH